ncbi:uncharacterized protein LOC124642416 isoform X1 [Helicoverpa zea]|uniref:uncharacterized protein LOC124642416 isoform X1 n=1 Tax=Helicoverpa zea TaxID=7113 RepID=UPI001F5726B2|nr:uncharacterized protein LOC124642416 isoform X1 [Helicoverpa zea]
MIFRSLFGYRQKFNSPLQSNFFVVFSLISFFMWSLSFVFKTYYFPLVYVISDNVEYCICFFVAFFTKEEYIYFFYKRQSSIDNLPGAENLFSRLNLILRVFVFYCFLMKIVVIIILRIFAPELFQLGLYLDIVMGLLQSMSCDMGRFTIILIVGLMYCRMKIIKDNMEMVGNDLRNRFAARKFTQMYQSFVCSLQRIDVPLKVSVTGIIIGSAMRITTQLFKDLNNIKENGIDNLEINAVIVYFVDPAMFLVISAVILDITTEYFSDFKLKCIEKKILCDNERERCEYEYVLLLLENKPFQFNIFRAVPLSVASIISFISFVVINIIAILQIKGFYA